MPWKIRKLPNKNLYRVYNPETGHINSYGTTKAKAEAQVRFLSGIKYSPKFKAKVIAASKSRSRSRQRAASKSRSRSRQRAASKSRSKK